MIRENRRQRLHTVNSKSDRNPSHCWFAISLLWAQGTHVLFAYHGKNKQENKTKKVRRTKQSVVTFSIHVV